MNFISKKYKNIILIVLLIGLAILISKKSVFESIKNIIKRITGCYEKFKCIEDNSNTAIKPNGLININPGKKSVPTSFYDAQKDFGYHSENLKTSEAEDLYIFLQSLVTPNNNQYNLTTSSTKKFRSSEESEIIILNFLKQKLESKIKNIELEDKIYYFKNQVCLDIQPFQISGEYIVGEENLGKVKVQLEMTFRFDQPSDVFISQTIFNKYSGVFKINRAILVNHKINEKKETKKNLPVKIDNNKPLTYSKYNFSYDNESRNQENFGLDTINSLIPDDIEITDYEKTSDYVSSQKVRL
jgi:hypothetical protein